MTTGTSTLPQQLAPKLLNWASEIDELTSEQAKRTSRLPIVEGHVALMPDAHFGMGSTVGSVIPTKGAVIPSAVGVDIGCGMIAVKTNLRSDQLPDSLDPLIKVFETRIPAGVGKAHTWDSEPVTSRAFLERFPVPFSDKLLYQRARSQFGTLGSGNHFVEVCLDGSDSVWLMLHSGSRGVGNKLAQIHINKAKKLMAEHFEFLEDPDLAYLVQGTPEFAAYIRDLNWAQEYAYWSRDQMMSAAFESLKQMVPLAAEVQRINCHHNYTALEEHDGKELWITRKGAIKAGIGDLGIIPGSMGTASYIVRGLGNPQSYESCSHGAGRRYSRSKAKKLFTKEDLKQAMKGRAWQSRDAKDLIDEIPAAYKDIDAVMRDQQDLVEVVETLRQVLNYKGVK